MTKEIFDFLSAVPNNDRVRIDLKFTSNGTQDMTKWHDILKSYKSCSIGISCDGVNDVYNYIRYPNTWKEWTESSKSIMENYRWHINCTVTIFNIFDLYNITEWGMKSSILDKLNLGYDNIPLVYTPMNLPKNLKDQAVNTVNEAIKISNNGHWKQSLKYVSQHLSMNQIDLWSQFVKITKQQDAHRKMSIIDIIPN